MKICYAASSGGHLDELMMLYPLMKPDRDFILTEKTSYSPDTKKMKTYLADTLNRKDVFFFLKFTRLVLLCHKILKREKPDIIVATGALMTFPICFLGKAMGKKIIFIESISRISTPTLTGKWVARFSDVFIVQWESMAEVYPDAVFGGGIY